MDTNTIYQYDGLRSIKFSYAGAFWVEEIAGASNVSVSVAKTQSVGQVGATQTAASVEPRTITVRGSYRGKNVAALREELLAAVAPGVPGRLTMTLGGASWYLDGTPTKTPDCSDGAVVQDFQFSFFCPYPYWRSTKRESTAVGGLQSMFKLPKNIGGTWWISRLATLDTNVQNDGNVEMPVEVTFRALTDVTTPEAYFVQQKKYIRLGTDAKPYTLEAGASVTVNTRDKTVVCTDADGTEHNAFAALDMTSSLDLALLPGDNVVRRMAAENADGLRVSIRRDLGVRSGL